PQSRGAAHVSPEFDAAASRERGASPVSRLPIRTREFTRVYALAEVTVDPSALGLPRARRVSLTGHSGPSRSFAEFKNEGADPAHRRRRRRRGLRQRQRNGRTRATRRAALEQQPSARRGLADDHSGSRLHALLTARAARYARRAGPRARLDI